MQTIGNKEQPARIGDYEDCPSDVYETLDKLLKYKEFNAFKYLRFKLIFSHKTKISKGRRTLATISLFKDKDGLLHDFEALIVIDYNYWAVYKDKREPLLYHELCHLHWDDELDKITLIGHDIEDFFQVYRRYGDWQKDIEKITVTQMQLQFEREPKVNA